jgi:hypothetical protein
MAAIVAASCHMMSSTPAKHTLTAAPIARRDQA